MEKRCVGWRTVKSILNQLNQILFWLHIIILVQLPSESFPLVFNIKMSRYWNVYTAKKKIQKNLNLLSSAVGPYHVHHYTQVWLNSVTCTQHSMAENCKAREILVFLGLHCSSAFPRISSQWGLLPISPKCLF